MKSKGQAINIDWTVGLSLFLLTSLSSVLIISQPDITSLGATGVENQLLEISSNLEEETYIEGWRTNLYVRTPVKLNSKIPVDRPYFFQDKTAEDSGFMNTTANVDVKETTVKAVVDSNNSTYTMRYYEDNISESTSTTSISTGSEISNSLITVEPNDPGLISLQIEGNELLNNQAEFAYSNYSIKEKEISATSFNGSLKVYEETPEIIVENVTENATFNLKNLTTLYWENDNSTTDLEGSVSKSGATKGLTIASDYGITLIGDLNATVTKNSGSDVVEAEVEAERLRIMLHNSDYVEGWKRTKMFKEGEIYFGISDKVEGATEENIKELNELEKQELEERLELGDLGYNITYGFPEAASQKIREVLQQISDQREWNTGSYSGTSADRKDNSGKLGIGYRNGSADTDLTEGLVGYWRMDRAVSGTSGTVLDYSGENNNGSYEGGVITEVNGVWSTKGSSFDGSSEYIDTGITKNYQTSSFSTSLWVKPRDISTGGNRLIVDDENDNGYAVSIADAGTGTIRFFVRGMDTVSLDTGNVLTTGKWYHIVGVFDNANNNRYIYVNGTREASITSDTGTPSTDSGDLHIAGDVAEGKHLNGSIDEVRIYNRSLSEEEIQKLYFNGKDGRFEGNYTSNRFGNDEEKNWTELKIAASVPSETELSARVDAYNEFGNNLGNQNLTVQNGLNNYSIEVRDSEQLQLSFNGTSENATKSWDVHNFTIFIDPENNTSVLKAGSDIPTRDTFARDSESLLINSTGELESIQNRVIIWR